MSTRLSGVHLIFWSPQLNKSWVPDHLVIGRKSVAITTSSGDHYLIMKLWSQDLLVPIKSSSDHPLITFFLRSPGWSSQSKKCSHNVLYDHIHIKITMSYAYGSQNKFTVYCIFLQHFRVDFDATSRSSVQIPLQRCRELNWNSWRYITIEGNERKICCNIRISGHYLLVNTVSLIFNPAFLNRISVLQKTSRNSIKTTFLMMHISDLYLT